MKIAILGFGTVGSGTFEALSDKKLGIEVKRILDIRKPAGFEALLTKDIGDITNDDEISVVVETMGGIHPAYEFVTAALNAGKHVVTANKQLVEAYYDELNLKALQKGVCFKYTASVGGGIPWLLNLRRQSRLDTITAVYGIVNGTTNFILDAMETTGAEFSQALSQAQRMGYAEADPSSDIDGVDSARKCAISASVAFGCTVSEKDISVFGIRGITARDVEYYTHKSLVCRLIMTAFIHNGKVRAYVEPVLITRAMLESGVHDNFNMITMECKNAGRLTFYGQGAGKYPTGMAVAQDLTDIALGIFDTGTGKAVKASVDNSLELHKYYIRSEYIPDDISVEHGGDGIIITENISVSDMHRAAEKIYEKDKAAFIAAINRNI